MLRFEKNLQILYDITWKHQKRFKISSYFCGLLRIYEIQYEHSLQFVYFVYESFLNIDSILSWYNRMQVITLWLQIIINIFEGAWKYLYYLEASKKVQDFVIFLLRLRNSPVIFVAFSKYIYEIFKFLWIQKRIVAAATMRKYGMYFEKATKITGLFSSLNKNMTKSWTFFDASK